MPRNEPLPPLDPHVLDALLGEAVAGEGVAPEAPGAGPRGGSPAESARLARLFAAARSAHEEAFDASTDERAVLRVRTLLARDARERGEHAAPRTTAPSAPRILWWGRVLAASVAVHALALGILAWRNGGAAAVDSTPAPHEGASVVWAPSVPAEDVGAFDGERDATAEIDGRLLALAALAEVPEPVPGAGPRDAMPVPRWVGSTARGSQLARRDPDAMARLLSRVGLPSAPESIRRGLDRLAIEQRADGSFLGGDGASSVRATAAVVLAFLGYGHSSGAGTHRDVVVRGLAWLEAQANASAASGVAASKASVDERALLVLALADDYLLSQGHLTPTQARTRAARISGLAETLETLSPGAKEPSPWASVASVAAGRVGLTASLGSGGLRAGPVAVAVPSGSAFGARDAALQGMALLIEGRVAAYREWNGRVPEELSRRLAPDGLVRAEPGTATAARIEDTAWILLALETPVRTY